jgi:hypothetical protein
MATETTALVHAVIGSGASVSTVSDMAAYGFG